MIARTALCATFAALALTAPRAARADGPTSGSGDLDKDVIQRVVEKHKAALHACYNKAVARHPTLAGKITVTFTIAPDGHVSKATTKGLTEAPMLGECIGAQFLRMVFPKPAGGATTVNYPLVFSAT